MLYGAAEFSRDCDDVILADEEYFRNLEAAKAITIDMRLFHTSRRQFISGRRRTFSLRRFRRPKRHLSLATLARQVGLERVVPIPEFLLILRS